MWFTALFSWHELCIGFELSMLSLNRARFERILLVDQWFHTRDSGSIISCIGFYSNRPMPMNCGIWAFIASLNSIRCATTYGAYYKPYRRLKENHASFPEFLSTRLYENVIRINTFNNNFINIIFGTGKVLNVTEAFTMGFVYDDGGFEIITHVRLSLMSYEKFTLYYKIILQAWDFAMTTR